MNCRKVWKKATRNQEGRTDPALRGLYKGQLCINYISWNKTIEERCVLSLERLPWNALRCGFSSGVVPQTPYLFKVRDNHYIMQWVYGNVSLKVSQNREKSAAEKLQADTDFLFSHRPLETIV